MGDDIDGCSALAKAMAGLIEPNHGLVQIAGFDALHAATSGEGRLIGYAGDKEIFHGTIRENVDLGRTGIGQNGVREVLQQVGLADTLLQLPDGLETSLQTNGHPLTDSQANQLTLARAIASKPKLMIVDQLLDRLDSDRFEHLWNTLNSPEAPWTLVVVTHRDDVAERFENRITIRLT